MGFKAFFSILKPKYTLSGVVREIGIGHSCEDLHGFTDLWLLEIQSLAYSTVCIVMQGRSLLTLKALPCVFVGFGVV